MADRTIKILTPATEIGFLSIAEARLLFGATTTVSDASLQFMIDINSASIMRLCNRIMAYEEVKETWRDIGNRRVFLSHWPVKEADVESVYAGGALVDPADYELEEESGKLSNFQGWAEDVVVTYWGGYLLPDNAPLPLKQATAMLVRDTKIMSSLEGVAGIRSLGYREKRVQFFDPTKILGGGTTGSGGLSVMNTAVNRLLVHYTRWEV